MFTGPSRLAHSCFPELHVAAAAVDSRYSIYMRSTVLAAQQQTHLAAVYYTLNFYQHRMDQGAGAGVAKKNSPSMSTYIYIYRT